MAILEYINLFMKKGGDVTLSELIHQGVVCFLGEDNRDSAIEKLVSALAKSGEILDEATFFEAILKREKIASTGIGMGVAIPHAKLPIFNRFFLAVGIQKQKEGIEWNALDGAPVRLVFMIGGPSNQQTEYLKILSRLTKVIKDEDRRKSLLDTKTKEDVMVLFKGF